MDAEAYRWIQMTTDAPSDMIRMQNSNQAKRCSPFPVGAAILLPERRIPGRTLLLCVRHHRSTPKSRGAAAGHAIEELVKELDGDVDVPGWDADLLEMLNSTEDEADEMIGSYGEFPESEISSINRQQNEEHVPYAAAPTYPVAPPDPQPVSTVSEPPQQPSPVLEVSTPTEPETAVPEAASGAEQHRYIRCPKCGELICL